MKVLAFIRAMRWKNLIIVAVVTTILGLVLTLYSCRKPGKPTIDSRKEVKAKSESSLVCTPAGCEDSM